MAAEKDGVRGCCGFVKYIFCLGLDAAFEYNTPKFVHIKNKKVGVINRLVQIAILGYVIGYGIIWQKGYQDTEIVQSVVTTKVKGASVVTDPSTLTDNCNFGSYYAMDHADLIVPPNEPDSFFITTNAWVTCGQTMGICGEDPGVPKSFCNETVSCEENVLLRGGNGITTGECDYNSSTCEIRGWCPVENENNTITHLGPSIQTTNYTVLVKNSISFPRLDPDFRLRNIPRSADKHFLSSCLFNDTTAGRKCPIFTLKQIVDMVNSTDGYYDYLATTGAVIGLRIYWDCNLDRSPESCKPQYSARRLDSPTSLISPGFNFRYPKYYYVDGVENRDLWKAYGIWFVVEVTGRGGQFNFFRLVLALGSTVGLLAVATIITDAIVLYVMQGREKYKAEKYRPVENVSDDLFPSINSCRRRKSDTFGPGQPLKGDETPSLYSEKM